MRVLSKRTRLAAGVSVWFIGVCVAMVCLWRYKTTPGEATDAPAAWPSESAIVRRADAPTIVMFAHPQCPCTKASMAQLAKLAERVGTRTAMRVVLVRPEGTSVGFEEGTLADRAHAIPGVTVVVDPGGVEAARFGTKVSGATVVYDRAGALRFEGGITAARGHEGDAPGFDRIVALVDEGTAALATAPTFGCEL